MVKVAFIDDGILPIFEDICLSSYIVNQNMVVPYTRENLEHSHATTCAAIFIQTLGSLVKDFEIISICILDKFGSGMLKDLSTAVLWAYENGIKIINLSLGGTHYFQQKMLADCVNYVTNKGVIIVAAQSNDNVFTYPASFSNVIGVKSVTKKIDKELVFNSSFPFDGIEFCANSEFSLPIYCKNGHKTEISNSFAAPVVSALVAKLCLYHINLGVFDAKRMLCEQFGLCSDNILPIIFDWSINSIMICFNRCYINHRCIQNTSIVKTYDATSGLSADFFDELINSQENNACDTLILYGWNDSANDILEKLNILTQRFRHTLFIKGNENNPRNLLYPISSNILELGVINEPLLLDETDSYLDIPIIKCTISNKHDLLFHHLEVLFDIVTAFRRKEYNCMVITDVSVGSLYDFITYRDNINLNIVNNLIKYRNIDLLLVAVCEENCVLKNFAFDLVFDFTQNDFVADEYIEIIENTFEGEA